AQSAQSNRFAGPSKHRPCSGPRHKRALAGRVAVTRVPEKLLPVPPVGQGQARPGVPVSVKDGSPVTQPPRDTMPPETSISAGPASMTGSTSAKLFFGANEEGSTFECSLDG